MKGVNKSIKVAIDGKNYYHYCEHCKLLPKCSRFSCPFIANIYTIVSAVPDEEQCMIDKQYNDDGARRKIELSVNAKWRDSRDKICTYVKNLSRNWSYGY